jgi:hypothetical protein
MRSVHRFGGASKHKTASHTRHTKRSLLQRSEHPAPFEHRPVPCVRLPQNTRQQTDITSYSS